jgi:putative transcriptional regulator
MSFGRHLRALRDEAGLSRAALARRAGVPVSTLRNWEHDRGFPGVAAGVRLAGALGVPVERLAEGVEDPAEDGPELGQETSQQVRQGKTPRPKAKRAAGARKEADPAVLASRLTAGGKPRKPLSPGKGE